MPRFVTGDARDTTPRAPVGGSGPDPAADAGRQRGDDPASGTPRTRLRVCLALTAPVIAAALALVPALRFVSWQWASLALACPCALGLATPTALLVGNRRGARLGILIKGPEVLEPSRRVDTILLDQTGTVTAGRMSVVEVVVAAGEQRDEVLGVAGALGSAAVHPVARAIASHAVAVLPALPPMAGFVAVDGLGAEGIVGDRAAVLGRPLLLAQLGVVLPRELARALAGADARGATAVVVAWAGRARAVVAVADRVRPSSRGAVADLRRLGLVPVLLSGDRAAAAERVAAEVGITVVVAEARPADKAEVVARLQGEGHVVAMVGDGVHAAAALAQADLGLATGPAGSAADLTLARDDLAVVVDAIRLARRTRRVIRTNQCWAVTAGALALPVAATGLLHTALAGSAMALSAAAVVANSLRLRRFAGSA